MQAKQLFQKSVVIGDFISISLKSDICDILANKSDTNEFNITVSYHLNPKNLESFSEVTVLGVWEYDIKTQSIVYELYEQDLARFFGTDTFPKVEIIAEIPENARLHINAIHSDVKIQDIIAEFQIEATNGDVSLQNAGHGSITSTNGFIKLQNINDNFDVETTNGNIHIKKGIGGVLNVTSTNGEIYLKETDFRKITTKSINGDIFAEMSNGNYDFMELFSEHGDLKLVVSNGNFHSILLGSKNGDTKISIPHDRLINMDLTTQNGEVEANIDTSEADEVVIDTEKFFVNFGEDLPSIQANSVNGDIVVKDPDTTFGKMAEDDPLSTDAILQKLEDSHTLESVMDSIDEHVTLVSAQMIEVNEDISPQDVKSKIINFINDKVTPTLKNSYITLKEKTAVGLEKIKTKTTFKSKQPSVAKDENSEAVMKILQMLENKTISVDEAEKLIKSLK